MSDSKPKRMMDTIQKLVGERVAVLCARYQYRGILAEANEDHLVLADAVMVEVSGQASGERAPTEDPLQCSATLSYLAIEMVYTPNWVNAPLPSENTTR